MRPIDAPRDMRDSRAMTSDDAWAEARDPATSAISKSRRVVAYLLLLAVCGSVAAMSWAGLYGFARTTLHWSDWHAALVPIALDIAAMSCALLALDSLARNDSATSFRVLTAIFVALSAFLNWRHSLGTHNIAEQVFFPAMSCLGYLFIDAVLRKYRRDTRNDRAGRPARIAPDPLPSHGLVAWARYPRRAFAATSRAIADRISEPPPSDAIAAPADSDTRRRDYAAGVVDGVSQADAIRAAIAEVGHASPTEVVAWLAANGRPNVAPQRVNDVIRRDRQAGRHRAIYAIPDLADQAAATEAEAAS